jgi:hypothetical protein
MPSIDAIVHDERFRERRDLFRQRHGVRARNRRNARV